MPGGPELEITKDLSDALQLVLGEAPTRPAPVVVLAAYLDALAKGHGLSESQHIDVDPLASAEPPAPALALVEHYLADGAGPLDADVIRDRLCSVFVELSQDRAARKVLNANKPLSDLGLLYLGQVYWNLEASGKRSVLPIQASQPTNGGHGLADIKVPGTNKDFATMLWTARVAQQGIYKSSGQGFRKQGARLAVLVAVQITGSRAESPPSLGAAVLNHTSPERGEPWVRSISWTEPDRAPAELAVVRPESVATAEQLPASLGAVQSMPKANVRVLVGTPADVGAGYQRREFDDEIERIWSGEGDRRAWLVGGPGLGKSFSARRVMQEAVADQEADREDLLVWVDSADVASVTTALAEAVDRLRAHGFPVPGGAGDPADRKARALLGVLAVCPWRWLVVLDNADAAALIEAGLVPPGRNRHGRVLVTTLSQDPRTATHGHLVRAGLFTVEEAEAYLRSEVHTRGIGRGSAGAAVGAEARALARCVGHHPLALSIAAATIVANAMTVADWITEFEESAAMDAAADEPDRGGYPRLIGGAWEVALERSSRGLPDGVVERAALVAAVQDPDGTPTWQWERDAVREWIGGGAVPARRGMPAVVRRLAEYGIVELRGENWREGHVAIHQLAARAVREQAGGEALAEIAAILADEWLIFLTEPESVRSPSRIKGMVRSNVRPIAQLPGLSEKTARTARAVLGYARSADAYRLERDKANLGVLSPYLARGGSLGRAEIALKFQSIGLDEAELGRFDEAQATFRQASGIYQELLEDRSLSDNLRAGYLTKLGELEARLGHPEESRAHHARAARILEPRLDADLENEDLGEVLVRLANVYEALGDHERRAALVGRADRLVERAMGDDEAVGDLSVQAETWLRLAQQLRTIGRPDEARRILVRTVAALEGAGQANFWTSEAMKELAHLHIEAREWTDAEDVLARMVAEDVYPRDELVLLASVRARRGLIQEAASDLAEAAERYPAVDADETVAPDMLQDVNAVLSERDMRNNERRLRVVSLAASSHQRWAEVAGLDTGVLELVQQRAEAEPGDHERDLAEAHDGLGMTYFQLDRFDKAEEHLLLAIKIWQVLAELGDADLATKVKLARALGARGLALHCLGRFDESAESLESAVSLGTQLIKRDPSPDARDWLSLDLGLLGGTYAELGRPDAAIDCATRRVEIWDTDLDPGDSAVRKRLATALYGLGWAYWRADRPEEAVGPLNRASEAIRAELEDAPENRRARVELAGEIFKIGYVQVRIGQPEAGRKNIVQSVAECQALTAQDPGDYEIQVALGTALGALGKAAEEIGDPEGAVDALSRAVNIFQLLADLHPGEYETSLVAFLGELAGMLRGLGRFDEADAATERVNDLVRRFPDLDR